MQVNIRTIKIGGLAVRWKSSAFEVRKLDSSLRFATYQTGDLDKDFRPLHTIIYKTEKMAPILHSCYDD